MAIPNRAVGYGNNSTARNVFRITFDQALTSAVRYEAYDTNGTFPAVGTLTTTTQKLFVGTAGNGSIPMLSLVDTTNAAPTSAWKPGSATGGSANPNRMRGTTNYVTQAGAIVGAAGVITFNMVVELPSDLTTSDNAQVAHDLLVRYTYAGTAPALTWAFNDLVSGTEGTPTWTNFTPGTHGIRHAKSGAATPNYYATIPTSGTQDTVEGWVTT